MGSGRGNKKRLNTQTVGSKAKSQSTLMFTFNQNKWKKWLDTQGISSVSIEDYYGISTQKHYSTQQFEFLIHELLGDAVDSEAIVPYCRMDLFKVEVTVYKPLRTLKLVRVFYDGQKNI